MKLWILFVIVTLSALAQAQTSTIYIKVGEASVKKSLMALPPFQFFNSSNSTTAREVGTDLFNTAYNDLTVADYFTFIRQQAFLEDTSKVGLKPAPDEPN